jgi:hypothetical protein
MGIRAARDLDATVTHAVEASTEATEGVSSYAYPHVIVELVAAVPELREDLVAHIVNQDDILGYVFVELDVTPMILAAWRAGRIELVDRCLAFLEAAMRGGDPETYNLIAVAFVEAIGPCDPAMEPFIAAWPEALTREARRQHPGLGGLGSAVRDGDVGSLNGLTFAPLDRPEHGEVDASTRFAYSEADGAVWAEYSGGDIVRGRLVGTRVGDDLDFRYVQLNRSGDTASGHCVSRVSVLPDGRLRLDETWEWESRDGNGTSVVEQVLGAVEQASG